MALALKQNHPALADEVEPAPQGGQPHKSGKRAAHRLHRTRIALALVGILLIAAAGVVRFVVLPAAAKLPANTNTTTVYAGTAPVLLNQAALAPGSTAPLLLTNLPLQIKESVRVLKANGSAAVADYRVTESAGGKSLPGMNNRYAVDRTTLSPSTAISGSGLTAARGLTISFPIPTQPRDYTGWVQDTGRTTPLRYAGTATRVPSPSGTGSRVLGFQAYVFKQVTPPAQITDPQELASLPRGVSKAEVGAVVAGLKLPASELARLGTAFGKLPNTVPLAYTYAARYTYWVGPRDGVVVDLQAVETRAVELPASVLGVAVPIATVSKFVYTDTPATLQAEIKQVKNDSFALTLVGTTLPLSALIIGFVLLVAAVLLRRRGEDPRPVSDQSTPALVVSR
ncbi:MAG: porin PorA family protein [Acidimicrobiales bacterium]|jgi:hypothetical protein